MLLTRKNRIKHFCVSLPQADKETCKNGIVENKSSLNKCLFLIRHAKGLFINITGFLSCS
ncbi:MAG: hypothetical protein EA412_09800 [Chitinophagaceae bacterium]|nr:MAG: hypothetical protein EA412_09800 [Chitinophagaceae bacterium]